MTPDFPDGAWMIGQNGATMSAVIAVLKDAKMTRSESATRTPHGLAKR